MQDILNRVLKGKSLISYNLTEVITDLVKIYTIISW